METHHSDPTSGDGPDPWDGVTAEVGALRDRLKEVYRRAAAEGGPDEEEIKSALATLGSAWNQLAGTFSTAWSDPDTRAHLRQAAGSLAAALGSTISGLGEELRSDSDVADLTGEKPVEEGGAGGGVVDGDGESATTDEGEL